MYTNVCQRIYATVIVLARAQLMSVSNHDLDLAANPSFPIPIESRGLCDAQVLAFLPVGHISTDNSLSSITDDELLWQ